MTRSVARSLFLLLLRAIIEQQRRSLPTPTLITIDAICSDCRDNLITSSIDFERQLSFKLSFLHSCFCCRYHQPVAQLAADAPQRWGVAFAGKSNRHLSSVIITSCDQLSVFTSLRLLREGMVEGGNTNNSI